ncbi:protein of unknown function (DUF4900) [Fodinibius salinus]|uniref:Uncharacterized protein n=1 Tax=Fodinibius salinus TaxID=860790 RepID=A0A5D3YQR2_9BACT|nr:DUF4900 domain-containing protein [Fodinibius salinus]TYP95658.1 protein of unknown function (DUF4900) [Fodinibius salinus]
MGRGLLILVSGMIVIVGIIQNSIDNRMQFLPEQTADYHQEMDAKNIANSLTNYGVNEMKKNSDWNSGFSSSDFMGAEVSLEVFDYSDYASNNPDIPDDHNIKDWDQYKALLVSKVKTNRTEAVTEVAVTRPSFSRYSYFTDTEASNIYFYDGDVLNGPVHTNGTFNIAGSPEFNGPVSSPNDWEGHPSYKNDPQFNDDTNFNSGERPMPDSDDLDKLRSNAQNDGLKFNEDIYANFKKNGTVEIWKKDYSGNWTSPTSYDLNNFNGVISSSKKIHTKGTIKGQATLHSEEQVEIMGDLKYAHEPKKNPNSSDVLGIVSEGDVQVDYNAHKDSGSKDVEINATIMALGESFEVEHHQYGNNRGTIELYGGIQQKKRGPVGTFGGGKIQSGYSKDYSYDSRMQNMHPPSYPRERTFARLYWKEKPVKFLNKEDH